MSAWPQAVWIVKKLQKNFDFTDTVNYYTVQLNTLNGRINNLIDRVENDERELTSRVVTFFSTANSDNTPSNPPSDYGKGTIWLVLK